MARLLEDLGKKMLRDAGLCVPANAAASTPPEAQRLVSEIGLPVVVKALVPTGRRGKAGAVRFCDTLDDVASVAGELLGTQVSGYPVESVLVEKWMDIRRELYLAIEIASGRPSYTLLASPSGGVEIESRSQSVLRTPLDPNHLPAAEDLSAIWSQLGRADYAGVLGRVTAQAVTLFVERDMTLLEINPLAVLPDGQICCVGALMSIDDNALGRHGDIAALAIEGTERAWRPETELEACVTAINADSTQRGSARYLELEGGNIGFLCGGGGASLLLFDALVEAGGTPANYSEFGGNPTEQRVYDLTRVVLDKPGIEGLFVAHNLTNNTQVDVVAAGVTRALADAGLPESFPVVAREAGLHDEEGRRIFDASGAGYFGEETTLNAAAAEMVRLMRGQV